MPTIRSPHGHARGGVAKLVSYASNLSTPHALLPHFRATAAKAQSKTRCCKRTSSTRRRRNARKTKSMTARRPVSKPQR